MTRLLTLAALVVGLSLTASTSEAGDWHHGGHGVHHGHHGGHGYAHGHSGYGRSAYSNYGYGGFYGGQSYGYGNGFSYQPRFQQRYAPSYRSYNRHQHGGLHVDIGRFHVLGIGGHHH